MLSKGGVWGNRGGGQVRKCKKVWKMVSINHPEMRYGYHLLGFLNIFNNIFTNAVPHLMVY